MKSFLLHGRYYIARSPNPEINSLKVDLEELADDMEEAAFEAGDRSTAGAARTFAAQRAVKAAELRESAFS